MSNQKRPSLTPRPATKAAKAAKQDVFDEGLRLTIDDTAYEARYGDISPQLARELRAEFGFGWVGLQKELVQDPGVDTLQAFVWLARRIKGEQLRPDDVEVDWADVAGLADDGAIEATSGETNPEA